MDYKARREIYLKHRDYFQILDTLGKGIMIKPHLEQYMAKFNKINKYKFGRDITKLKEAKLIEVMKLKNVTIISLTSVSLMFLRDKKTVKEVSTTSVKTNRNLKMSMVKSEYILQKYLSVPLIRFEDFKKGINETTLFNKSGDNAKVIKALISRHQETKSDSILESLQTQLTYIEACKNNKEAQMSNSKKNKIETNFNNVSINNLQARHIYFIGMGRFKIFRAATQEQKDVYTADIRFVYLEITDLFSYQRLRRDMDTLSSWLISNVAFGKINIDVVVEPSRKDAITDTIKQWQRKRLNAFCTTNVQFNIIEIDVTKKYLKGLNISI